MIKRLSNREQRQVRTSHVQKAVRRLVAGYDAANFAESRDYDVLLSDGTRLAPKKVFGLALEEALGIEAFPGHFSAGWSQPSFQIIEAAGFRIVAKDDLLPTAEQVEEALIGLPIDEQDRVAIEGNLRIAIHIRRERASGLARAKKAAFIQQNGRLFCERCSLDPVDLYGPNVADACIEVHHATVGVKDMNPGHTTTLEDLQCLCANCHRVTHRELSSIR